MLSIVMPLLPSEDQWRGIGSSGRHYPFDSNFRVLSWGLKGAGGHAALKGTKLGSHESFQLSANFKPFISGMKVVADKLQIFLNDTSVLEPCQSSFHPDPGTQMAFVTSLMISASSWIEAGQCYWHFWILQQCLTWSVMTSWATASPTWEFVG